MALTTPPERSPKPAPGGNAGREKLAAQGALVKVMQATGNWQTGTGNIPSGITPLQLFAGIAASPVAVDLAAHLADLVDAHDASAISNVAAGGIAATTVQAAIDELDTEKAPKASPTFTGTVLSTLSTGAISAVVGSAGIEARGETGAGHAAFMTFHRPGAFAAAFGIDTDNVWKVGGWSTGAVSYTIWHSGNDGAGSGLDADLLDGLSSAAFAQLAAVQTFTAVNNFTALANRFNNTAGQTMNTATGNLGSLEVTQATAGADAFMTFHVAGDFATYFGLDGTTNDLAVGGWSGGAVKNKIWHAGNVPDEAYGSGWNGSVVPPTKNALYDKIETIVTYGAIWGLILSNAAVDTVNDINVTAGAATNSTNNGQIVLAAAIVKQFDAAWAVGTNAGGMNTGVVANSTWYEVHLIRRSDTGVVDVMITTAANRATLPTGYDSQRYLGSVRRGVATNLQFTQIGDHFTLTTQIMDADITPTVTAAQVTLTVPPSTIARFRGSLFFAALNAASIKTVLSEIVEGNVAPQGTTGIVSLNVSNIGDTAGFYAQQAGHFELRANASSQIEHDSDLTGGTEDESLVISTFGWIDHRERLQ